jgi:ATP-dependent protease HslVU (ClpYQ) ATPase subunit
VNRAAVERVESNGIIFLDEIDKIAGREAGTGPMYLEKECSATFCRLSRAPR